MSPELTLTAAFLLAAATTYATTPGAISLALRTNFLDRPAGYKGHGSPTPYLGGAAIAAGATTSTLLLGGGAHAYAVVVGGALAVWALGTVDDRHNISPLLRVVVEVAVAIVLWRTGHGWSVLGSGPADAALTVVWVVGIVNAFNLMDNMNGAAATTAGISAFGAGVLAALNGQIALSALALALAGACAGFIPYNLARPSRVFMGDGGSMFLGLLVACVAMAAPVAGGRLHLTGIVAAALIAGLPILDTSLVIVSRRRGGRPLLIGGRDHLTHRLRRRLGGLERVTLALAAGQGGLCAAAVLSALAGPGWVLGVGAV